MIKNRKITIIGNGHVGSHCAYALALQSVCEEIALIDLDEGKNIANAFDVADGIGFFPNNVHVFAGTYKDCEDADIIVVSIGQPRKPGQTRLDMLDDSIRMLRIMIKSMKEVQLPDDVVVITITNPADIIAYYTRAGLELPRTKVFSTGTSLDTARLKRTLSEFFEVDPRSLSIVCLGEHGDSSMVPYSTLTIGGRFWMDIVNEKPEYYVEKLKALKPEIYKDLSVSEIQFAIEEHVTERTHYIGYDIINGKGSTEFGIASALADMAKAVMHDEHRILPASVLLEGEYKNHGMHIGVPCMIGKNGIEQIIQLPLTSEEQIAFDKSCATMTEYIERAKNVK